MKYNILIGGKAGQGPNILSELVAKGLLAKGYYVFYSRDYQSLIRGGHNFNVISFSDSQISSNPEKINILVALDDNTLKVHKQQTTKQTIILNTKHPNMYFAGSLFKILNIDFKVLDNLLKELSRYEDNIKEAKQGYEQEKKSINIPNLKNNNLSFMNGNEAIALGALKSGIDIYYAYPMTPATGVLTELAQKQKIKENKHLVIQLENEIAVINAGIGSSITGKKVMIGTSGGGFDLMTEGLSLAGMAESPLVIYLSQRPGPATGVPTYTGQGDLKMALNAGHGEFQRVVLAPGSIKEAIELTSQCFYFSQKYKIPVILLGDKHLAESKYSFKNNVKIIPSPKSITKLERHSSYETDSEGSSTEDPTIINKNIQARLNKKYKIELDAQKFQQYKIYGKQESKNIILGWGSTKGAILEAIQENNLDCDFLQIIYMEPFPKEIAQIIKDKNIILVENNATAQLADVLMQNIGIKIQDKNKILKYDGRPFTSTELKDKISEKLK